MQTHFTLKHSILAASLSLLALAPLSNAQANTAVVSGTINQVTGGTSFDTWKINMQTAGAFTVDLMAYEASQSNTSTAGYYASDLNGDGELTWLDPDTYFYTDDGHLDAVDALVRCDDTQNNCAVYQNGLTAATSPAVVTSHLQSETPVDGSIHFQARSVVQRYHGGRQLFLPRGGLQIDSSRSGRWVQWIWRQC